MGLVWGICGILQPCFWQNQSRKLLKFPGGQPLSLRLRMFLGMSKLARPMPPSVKRFPGTYQGWQVRETSAFAGVGIVLERPRRGAKIASPCGTRSSRGGRCFQ